MMKALVFDKTLSFREIERPARKKGEALIRVLTAGICNTDIEITRGYMDFSGVPGHEFIGIVEESDNAVLTGQRVVGDINAGCGVCERCRDGDPRHCKDRTTLGIFRRDGAFAEYLTLPERNLYPVPASIDNETAVFTEPFAAALQVFDEHDLPETKRAAVIGDGKLGLLIVLAARARGFEPILFGLNEKKFAIAAKWGIGTVNAAVDTNERFDLVIECSGNPAGLQKALGIIEPKGTIVLKSTYAADASIDFSRLVVNEITLIGSRCGRFAPALKPLEQEKSRFASMITARYKLEDGHAAFEHAQKPDALKILFTIAEG